MSNPELSRRFSPHSPALASAAWPSKRGVQRLAITLLLLLLTMPAWAEAPLKFGVLALRSQAQAMLQWQPLATYLESRLGRRVELTAYSYSELDAAVMQKTVDIVLTNPGHFVLLQHRNGLSAPLATQVTEEGGRELSAFGGVIFTRADASAINSLADLAGKRIAAASTDSLGGYQMQAFELEEAGIASPDKGKLLLTGLPYERTVEAVLAGRADAGFVRSGVLETLAHEGKITLDNIKVIQRRNLPSFPYASTTRLYPEWPVVLMPQVNEQVARHLTLALLSLAPDSAASRAAGIHGFTNPADYGGVEDLLRSLRMPPFDTALKFTAADLWHQYSRWIIALGVLMLLLVGAGAALLGQNRRIRQGQQRFATLFEASPEPMTIIADGRFIDCNMAALKIFGHSEKSRVVAHSPADLSPACQPDGESSRSKAGRLLEAATGGELQRFEWLHLKADGNRFIAEVSLAPCTLNGQAVVLCVLHDITARKQAELREQHHKQVLQMLAAKMPLASVLYTIASDVETINPDMLCCILLLDDESKYLRRSAAPSLPEFFTRAIDGIAIGPGICSCGSAAFSGERVIVEDIENHPWWAPFLSLTRQAGLGACWSQPVISGQGKVLGTFAIYHRHSRQPSAGHLQLLEDGARLAALAIEKSTAETRVQLAASVFTHAREGIMITNAAGDIVEVNETFTRITGYTREEALGQNPRMLKSGRQPPEYYAAMWQSLIQDGHWYGETWNRRKNGEVYAEMITISAVRDAEGKTQNYVALFTDITPMKEHEQQLEYIAHYDALTSLPNRVLLADRLQQGMIQSQRRGQSLAVVYLDLDGFKTVNDHHGHDVGDDLLITVAQRMKDALRDGDTLARLGGDEFVAVLVDLEWPQDCEPVLARLLQAAADPVKISDAVLQVSASIGVTIYPQDGVDAEQLMRHADQAMYIAKQAGKNRYHLFDVDHDAAVKIQRESLEHIRRALDRQEFVLYYQPKVNMRTGAVIGAEALIRWQHPERGLLAPGSFLPVIEDHPISVEVGEWVIDTALSQMSAWHAEGLDIPVSVNIGAPQLQQVDFVTRLSALIAAHPDIRPGCLELEVLETSALEDMVQASKVMRACLGIGVHFALDDFGTGYSSLTYLKRLPADVLKIDQSFVRDMLDDSDDLTIVEGVLGLASAFHRSVIAEGVESVAHGALLLALGCDLGQGHGIARPMPATQLPAWVASWQPDASWKAWHDRPLSNDHRMVIFAEVKHRHWMRDIEIYLAGNRDAPPPMDTHKCHFGRWQESEGRARYGEHSEFELVIDLHDRVHALGHELVKLHDREEHAGIPPLLEELHTLRDELIASLRRLIAFPELNELTSTTEAARDYL